jgi:hypothetical protein
MITRLSSFTALAFGPRLLYDRVFNAVQHWNNPGLFLSGDV